MSKRVVVILGSLAVTITMGLLAFLLGAWGYDARRFNQHNGRLQRLLEQKPTLPQVVEGLEKDGSPQVAAADGPAELERIAAERGGNSAGEILQRGRRWARTRVFAAADMLYFLFFDAEGVMRDFVLVSRR
jgi:hypothetical protein